MQCADCEGKGCDGCEDGRIVFAACPLTLISPDIWEVIELARFYKKGLPPIAGGVLDQTASFLEAAQQVWNNEARFKAKLGIDCKL